MEREVWKRIIDRVKRCAKPASCRRFRFSDEQIVSVYLWSVLHHRPVYWACRASNWSEDVRPDCLPSPATMSRRLETASVNNLLMQAERRAQARAPLTLLHIVDGKPLPIGRHSHDADAGYGRGAGGMDKGYKLHVIAGKGGTLEAWEVCPIHHDEAKVAATLLRRRRLHGYLLADKNYDRNSLYAACRRRGIQLLAPRRYGRGRGLGHHPHDPSRRYAVEQLEQSLTGFAEKLMRERRRIERLFGSLCSSAFGLLPLPPWVRGSTRVRRWIASRLLIWHAARRRKPLPRAC